MFLHGLRKFVARHGSPHEIISDNASHFNLAKDTVERLWDQVLTEPDVISYSTNGKIKWTFIVELAPWMGGFYERLIGLVKRSLGKAIGKALFDKQSITNSSEGGQIIHQFPPTGICWR